MRVSTKEVRVAFEDLLSGSRTREELAGWASLVRSADDAEGIQYEPPEAEPVIWEALEFLMGADLKDGPDSYLHNQQDLEDYWSSKKGDLMG